MKILYDNNTNFGEKTSAGAANSNLAKNAGANNGAKSGTNATAKPGTGSGANAGAKPNASAGGAKSTPQTPAKPNAAAKNVNAAQGVKATPSAQGAQSTQSPIPIEQRLQIRAPYRFVSLNPQIFYPQDAQDAGEVVDGEISFDKPFKGALSGEIELKITFKSDFFVGAATAKKSKDEQTAAAQNVAQNPAASASAPQQSGKINVIKKAKSGGGAPIADKPFFTLNGEPALPGSSVRGTFRTIAEVLSFARLQTQDKRLSYRDLRNEDYLDKIQKNVYAGFLRKKTDEKNLEKSADQKESSGYVIENHGQFSSSKSYRIRYFPHEDSSNETSISSLFDEKIARDIKSKKKALEKYEVIIKKYPANENKRLLKGCETQQGIVVFTGTTDPRKKAAEFFFPLETKGKPLEVSNEVFENFKLAYGIGLRDAPYKSEIYEKLFKGVLDSGGKVPVFFALDECGEVSSFGFSYLYKFPYENKTGDLLAKNQPADVKKLDMVERIFGFVEDGAGTRGQAALRSRVSFSHFTLDAASKSIPHPASKILVLSSPRVTFYPFYLEQGANVKFKTFDNADARLAGFKFYPPRQSLWEGNPTNDNENIKSRIHPLAAGCAFSGKMRFFNLTAAELGLLLRAVSVFDGKDEFYKFGGAKPYGYGDAAVRVVAARVREIGADGGATGGENGGKSGGRIGDVREFAGDSAEFREKKAACEKAFLDLLAGAKLDFAARENELKRLARRGEFSDDKALEYMELKEFADLKSDNFNKFRQKGGGSNQKSGAKSGNVSTSAGGSRPVSDRRSNNGGGFGGFGSKFDDMYENLRKQRDDDDDY